MWTTHRTLDKRSLTRALVCLSTTAGLPFSTVTGDSFVRVLRVLGYKHEIPTSSELRETLDRITPEVSEYICDVIASKGASVGHITTDAFNSDACAV